MHPLLKVDISELSISERIQLAEDLWDSILTTPDAIPLSETQKQELDRPSKSKQRFNLGRS